MKRLIAAFKNSTRAFKHLAMHEEAVRLELVLLALAVPLSYLVGGSVSRALFLFSLILFVIIVEVLNTAVEAACDAVTREFNENIRLAKDCGSLAVLLAIFMCAIGWGWMLIERLIG